MMTMWANRLLDDQEARRMSQHHLVPISRSVEAPERDDPPSKLKWRCVDCDDRWVAPPDNDDECPADRAFALGKYRVS